MNVILQSDYAPLLIKERIRDLSVRIKEAAAEAGLPFSETKISEANTYPPKSFNLASALHHSCGTAAFVYESNQGIDYGDRELKKWETVLTCEEILREHYVLFEQTVRSAAKNMPLEYSDNPIL